MDNSWLLRLRRASFRGVHFKVSDDEATFGRRSTTYEYPMRDIPFTDDMGRKARKYSLSAYVIGLGYMVWRDRLLAALEKGGPGTLIHPLYGTLTVNVDGEIRVRHSRENGGMCEISVQFVESGQLSYPTTGDATAQNAADVAKKTDALFTDKFLKDFKLEGFADWVATDVIGNVSKMLGEVIRIFNVVDRGISDAASALQDDLASLLPPPVPPGTGLRQVSSPAPQALPGEAEFARRVQEMWASGQSAYLTAESALIAIDNLKYIISAPALAPRGAWATLSATARQTVKCTNACAQLLRATALSQAVRQFSAIPAPPAYSWPTARTTQTMHPAITDLPGQKTATRVSPASDDQLTRQRMTCNTLFDQEANRVVGDRPFAALEALRQSTLLDIKKRLQQTSKMMTRIPSDVTPAVVLASDWYDDAARGDEIVALNTLPHPGFIPPEPLRVAAE